MERDENYLCSSGKTSIVTARGVALIAVLFLVSLLSLIAISVLGIARMRSQVSARQFESIQAMEVVDSAIRVTLLELAAPRNPQGALIVGSRLTRQVTVFDDVIDVSLDFESGRVDINFADEAMLTALFEVSGIPKELAAAYAQRVLDWRDPDDRVTGRGGAERAEYLRAKLNYGPRNAPFESVTELRQVLGLENLTDAQLDAFTVYTHVPTPTPQSSVDSVRKALDWLHAPPIELQSSVVVIDAAASEQTPASQKASQESPLEQSQDSQVGASVSQSVTGQVVRLRACAIRGRTPTCRLAIVRFTGNNTNPFLVFVWQTIFVNTPAVAMR